MLILPLVYSRKKWATIGMGNKVVQIDGIGKTLTVGDTEYKHPRAGQWKPNDIKVYKSLVAQTKVKSFPNTLVTNRLHATWKWKHMLKKMVIPGERIAEKGESEDTADADSVGSYPGIASIGDMVELHLVY